MDLKGLAALQLLQDTPVLPSKKAKARNEVALFNIGADGMRQRRGVFEVLCRDELST